MTFFPGFLKSHFKPVQTSLSCRVLLESRERHRAPSLFLVFVEVVAAWEWDFPGCNHLVAFPGTRNIMIMDTGSHRKPMKLMVCLGILGQGKGLGILGQGKGLGIARGQFSGFPTCGQKKSEENLEWFSW